MDTKSIGTYYGFIFVKKSNGQICGRYPLTEKVCVIGRDRDCNIRIFKEKVSGHHCSVLIVDDKAYIRDTSLLNSTKVNGKNVGRSNFLLHHSDEIQICGRTFIWEYAKSYTEFNNVSNKKSIVRNVTPRLTERSITQINTPHANNKMSMTPAKSITKSASKTLISFNKTPILVTTSNMSKSSFDEVKINLQKQNSSIKCQSEPQTKRSYSMVLGRNIPVIGDSKVTQRKSWVVTNTLDNSSSSGLQILNKLSTERLKRDSTPEFNSSYRYQDEEVEFDSPEPPSAVSNVDNFDVEDIDSSAKNNLSEVQSESVNQNDDGFSVQINILSNSEPEPGTSRRDTYSVDAGSIIIEQNATPTPRRSILKCSKTVQPNRSRTSCRMVQFARLPKSDSRIKSLKSRFGSKSNFVVSDDLNEADVTQDSIFSRKSTQIDVDEEYDDDLDGVQPLDVSVSSLIHSPILDNSSVNKSSKRGSRGNKVMSLIGSFENRIHDSPKASIRASDLLSMNESKTNGDTSPNNDSRNSSVSSTRRINLENVFVAEDSLNSASCNFGNKSMLQEIEESIELISKSKMSILNDKNTENISEKVLDPSSSNHESEFSFASPLKINSEFISSSITETNHNNSTFVDTEKDNNSTKDINKQCKVESTLESIDTSDVNNCIKNNSFNNVNQTLNEEVCTNASKISNNVSVLVEKNILEGTHLEQNSISEFTEKSMNDFYVENDVSKVVEKSTDKEKDSIDVQNDVSFGVFIENSNAQSDVSKLVEKSAHIEKDYTGVENNDSINVEKDNSNAQSDVSILVDKSTRIEKDHVDIQNDVSTFVENTISIQNQSNVQKDVPILSDKSLRVEKDRSNAQSNVSKLVDKSTILEKDHIDLQNKVTELESTINVQSDVSKIVEKSINSERGHSEVLNNVSKLIDEESPSMVVQCMSKMFNTSVDELEKTHSQHKETLIESYVVVDKCNPQNVSNSANAASTEDLNKSMMDAIEVQLDKMHDDNSSSNSNEYISVSANSLPDTDIEKTITLSLVSEETETVKRNLDNSSKKSIGMLQVTESTKNIFSPRPTTKLSVGNVASTNCSNSNIQSNDVSQLIADKSVKDFHISVINDSNSTLIKVIDKSIDLSTIPVVNCCNIQKERNELMNNSHKETSDISEDTLNGKNSRNLNKSQQSTRTTRASRKIIDEDIDVVETEVEMKDTKIDKSYEGTLDTSIGKPRYESTPWNKSSKTFNSTTSIQANENSHGDIFVDELQKEKSRSTTPNTNTDVMVDQQNKINSLTKSISSMIRPGEIAHNNITENVDDRRNMRSPSSPAPTINLNQWSPMMKEFNESVRKACSSTNSNFKRINRCNKVLFSEELGVKPRSDVFIKITSEEGVSSNYIYFENNKQESENKNTGQCLMISSCSSNNTLKTSNECDQDIQSTRSRSKSNAPPLNSRRTSPRTRQSQPRYKPLTSDSEEIIEKKVLYNKNNSEIKKPSPSPKSITSCRTINNKPDIKTDSKITDIAVSTSESNQDSSSDSNLNKPVRVTRTKNKEIIDNVVLSNKNNSQTKVPSTLSKKSVTDCSTKNNKPNTKTASRKPDITVSTSESKQDSSTDSSSNKPARVTRTKNKELIPDSEENIDSVVLANKNKPSTSFKSISNCPTKNNKPNTKTASKKTDIAVSTSESKQDSSSDSSSNKTVRVTRTKKMTKKKNSGSKLPPTRRNLRVKVDKNELDKSNQKHSAVDEIVSDNTLSGNNTETGTSRSTNVLQTTKRALRKREHDLSSEELKPTAKHFKKPTSSNHSLKNTSNSKKKSAKISIIEKTQEIQPVKTRLTRSDSTVNQSSLPKLNKTSSPTKIKAVKVGKIKKTTNLKTIKKSQTKSIPSKPIKGGKSDSSEYESVSETEEIPQKSRIVDSEPKAKKENIKKKNVQLDDSSSIPTKRNLREKVGNLIVPSQSSTRSCKRAAETSPLYEPNSKGLRRDITSKVASTANSRVSNSPNNNTSSSTINRTRNKSKSAVTPEPAKTVHKEKVTQTKKNATKKREINSDNNLTDSAPPTKKKTRQAPVKVNESDIKKPSISTRTKSRLQNTSTDDSNSSTKVRSNKNTINKSISPKAIKTRATKQVVSKSTSSRALRSLREKK